MDKKISDGCYDGKTYDTDDEHKDDNKKRARDKSLL